MNLIEFINIKLAVLTVLAQVFILAAAGYWLFWRKDYPGIGRWVGQYGLWFAFIVALGAMLCSLFYSEAAGYEPCILCWYQRIALFPQVILLGGAAIKNNRAIRPYALWLSVIGALIAGYQHLMQVNLVADLPCSAGAVSCTKAFVMEFGYITMPLMSFTAFALIIIFLLAGRALDSKKEGEV